MGTKIFAWRKGHDQEGRARMTSSRTERSISKSEQIQGKKNASDSKSARRLAESELASAKGIFNSAVEGI